MTSVGLFVFLAGLVLGVFAMLHGTQRRVQPALAPHERTSEHDPAAEPSALFNLASIAAFTVVGGLTAYLVSRHAELPLALEIVIALGAGALSLSLQSLLIARWAIPSARAEQVDHRYLLQGSIGRVTRSTMMDGEGVMTGAMTYTLDGRSYDLPVRSMDGGAVLDAGTEVVIDRVENGTAYVESWSAVEQRL